jgi:hypothetical protein
LQFPVAIIFDSIRQHYLNQKSQDSRTAGQLDYGKSKAKAKETGESARHGCSGKGS